MQLGAAGVMRGAAAVALAGALGACHPGADPLDAPAFERQLHALGSLSMEAAFVADEAHAGHLTSAYVRAHLEHLLEDAADARHELARPALPSLAARQQAAQALAAQLTQALREIAVTPPAAEALLQQEAATTRLKHQFDALGSTR
jgi:hypothetical protein